MYTKRDQYKYNVTSLMNPEDNNLSPRPQAASQMPPALPSEDDSSSPYASKTQSIYPTPLESNPVSPATPTKPQKNKDGWRSISSTILLFLAAPLIAITIAAFVIQSYQVDGQSMDTTLQHRDRLIVNKLPRTWSRITKSTYIPKRGEIIIFNYSGISSASALDSKQLIKRVVGLPGERVVVKDGKITIYNEENPDGFNPDKQAGYSISAKDTPGEIDQVIPKDYLFVCGDNRTNSEDSRFFGPISAESVVGELAVRLFPIDKFTTF